MIFELPKVATIHQALGMWVHPDDPQEVKDRELEKAKKIARQWERFERANRVNIRVYPFLLETTSPPYARNGFYEYRKTELREQAAAAYPHINMTHWISGNANTGSGAQGWGIKGGRFAMCDRGADWDTYDHEGSTGHNGITHLIEWPAHAPEILKRMKLMGRKHSAVAGSTNAYSDGAYTMQASSRFGRERWGKHAWDLIMQGKLMPVEYDPGISLYRIAMLGIHHRSMPEGYIPCLLIGATALAPRRDTGTTTPVSPSWRNRLHVVSMDHEKQTFREGVYPEGQYTLRNGMNINVLEINHKGATVEISE